MACDVIYVMLDHSLLVKGGEDVVNWTITSIVLILIVHDFILKNI